MATDIETNAVIKCTARLEMLGSIAVQNTFFAWPVIASPMDGDDGMADLAEWLEDIYTPLLPLMVSTCSFVDILFHDVHNNTPIGTLPWPTLTAGTSGNDPSATGVAAIITAYTGVVGRRGRKSFGVFDDGTIQAALFTGGVLAILATTAAAWITPFVGGTSGENWVPGVYSRKTGTFSSFTEAVARAIPGYQRRRKQNVGI
jgi:uncharacterized membrane protein YhdT